MIVEEQGIDFRTGVRFPSAPLGIMPVFPYFIRDSGIFFLEMLDYLFAVLITFFDYLFQAVFIGIAARFIC